MTTLYVTKTNELIGSDGDTYYAKRSSRNNDYILVHAASGNVVMQAKTVHALKLYLKAVKIEITETDVIYNLNGFKMSHPTDPKYEVRLDW